jgi:hypothetical protein
VAAGVLVTVVNTAAVDVDTLAVPVVMSTAVGGCAQLYAVSLDDSGSVAGVWGQPSSCGTASTQVWLQVGALPGATSRRFVIFQGAATSGVAFPPQLLASSLFDVLDTFTVMNPDVWMYPPTAADRSVTWGSTGVSFTGNWTQWSVANPAHVSWLALSPPFELRVELAWVGCGNAYVSLAGADASSLLSLRWSCTQVCYQSLPCRTCVNATSASVVFSVTATSASVQVTDVCGVWSPTPVAVAVPDPDPQAYTLGIGARTVSPARATFSWLSVRATPPSPPTVITSPLPPSLSAVLCRVPPTSLSTPVAASGLTLGYSQNSQNFHVFTAAPVDRVVSNVTGLQPSTVTAVYRQPLWIVGSGFPAPDAPTGLGRRLVAGQRGEVGVRVRFGSGATARETAGVVVNSTHVWTVVPDPVVTATYEAQRDTPVFLALDGVVFEQVATLREDYSLCSVITEVRCVPASALRC